MPDWNNPNNLWERDEEFRQTVIRQAILLGFNGTETELTKLNSHICWWTFELDGRKYDGYASCYGAALEYLRLIGVPFTAVGAIRVAGG